MNHQLAVIDVVLRLGIEGDKVILGLALAGHHADIVTAHQRIQQARLSASPARTASPCAAHLSYRP